LDAQSGIRIDVQRISGGGIRLGFATVQGRSYRIERSDNLKTWEPLGSDVEGTGDRVQVPDPIPRAFYSPDGDYVGMPEPELFRTPEDYYSVLFHELTHSTGHESRLNRKGVTGSDGLWSAFGSQPYSQEELVAEMGAAFLCGQAGIVERTIDNSVAYIRSWLQRLKDDRRLIVQAAAQAQKASDFILARQFAEETGGEQ